MARHIFLRGAESQIYYRLEEPYALQSAILTVAEELRAAITVQIGTDLDETRTISEETTVGYYTKNRELPQELCQTAPKQVLFCVIKQSGVLATCAAHGSTISETTDVSRVPSVKTFQISAQRALEARKRNCRGVGALPLKEIPGDASTVLCVGFPVRGVQVKRHNFERRELFQRLVDIPRMYLLRVSFDGRCIRFGRSAIALKSAAPFRRSVRSLCITAAV